MASPLLPFSEEMKEATLSSHSLYKAWLVPLGKMEVTVPCVVSHAPFCAPRGLPACQLIVITPPRSYPSLMNCFIFLKGTASILTSSLVVLSIPPISQPYTAG